MIYEVLRAGNPVLKQVSEPVEKIDRRIRRLLDDMHATMLLYNGIGLAAPQIGKYIRAIVIELDEKRYDLINPKILKREGKSVDTEGCLSVPDLFGEVERSEKVEVEFLDRYGKKKKIWTEGLLARCVQHEIDHLDGQLFIDIAQSVHRGEEK